MTRRDGRTAWESFGAEDPDWAVLTDPAMRGGGWTSKLDAFYESGEVDVARDLEPLPDLLLAAASATAVDWGCGTGRLSFALARRFQRVVSVDIAESMLAMTRKRAEERGITNLELVQVDDLTRQSAALVYSAHVLQHLPSHAAMRATLTLACASVAQNGYLIVDVPSRINGLRSRVQPRYRLWSALSGVGVPEAVVRRLGGQGMSMRALSTQDVCALLVSEGLTVVQVTEASAPGVTTAHYVARRDG